MKLIGGIQVTIVVAISLLSGQFIIRNPMFVFATKLLISLLTGLITHLSILLKCFKMSNRILHRTHAHSQTDSQALNVYLIERKTPSSTNIERILH